MFLDTAEIICKAGNGGNGVVSWRREKYVPKGGPDGGDGGKGGDIIIRADASLNSLIDFKYKKKYFAQNGFPGKGGKCYGKNGKDLTIKVPCGTVVRDSETNAIIADLTTDGEEIVLLFGGRGGRGNAKFATSTRRSPGFSETGTIVPQKAIQLELKIISDIGLIGFPNVGKSSLLSLISAAKPKIANYHFTTLSPNVGVVNKDSGEKFLVADIPGLIEGASNGAGLGHSFLRHIERVRLLLHIVDISGSEGREPIDDYEAIRLELSSYSKALSRLPEVIVANKSDLLGEDESKLKKFRQYVGKDVYVISCVTGFGLSELLDYLFKIISTLPKLKKLKFTPFVYEERDPNEFKIEQIDGVFYVYGAFIEKIVRGVVLSNNESFRWFQKVLRDKGVILALEKKGLKSGDIIRILNHEFEYLE